MLYVLLLCFLLSCTLPAADSQKISKQDLIALLRLAPPQYRSPEFLKHPAALALIKQALGKKGVDNAKISSEVLDKNNSTTSPLED